ncbi:MAG: fumarate hydratase [Candidatus Thiodiazotropha sp. (ex. Lucinisca nassula)]|nr:fumarate hydratase [Candidatus Thiodiazotropha sp. (ex. Lucinisca nassula)]MBW9274679.1 fumarate hydratase [Candidatus Thiodiazotropha sp. (ex. Lucinisca nassula)]PUB83521.1 MAG: fumarate hydratase [gamma proteobacterium symbiont of Ctena orbiculata]PUB89777.1 MAG: fumarate hydratase [gamma proteobacterium symbiont of Ctena orbiculata]
MSAQESNKLRVNLNPISLEADLAYFGARLELVGEPETQYQAAQLKVYKALEAALEENLKRLRKKESRSKAKTKKKKE